MNDDERLNEYLRRRDMPAPSSNLAYRITQAAQPKTKMSMPTSWIDELFSAFLFPKPAYATAFCLIVGLGIGLYAGVDEVQAQDWFSFLETQEGEWL